MNTCEHETWQILDKVIIACVQIKIKKSELRNVDFNLIIWYNKIFLT